MDKIADLIEIVRKYPMLYDTSHEDYRDKRTKNRLWASIAESMQEGDGDIVRSRWKNLRDSYSKHLRVISGEESKYLDRYRFWPWVSQMSFLQPFLEVIPSRTNRGVKKAKPLRKHDQNDFPHTFKEETTSDDVQNEEPVFVDSHRMIETQPDVSQYFVDNKCVSTTTAGHHDAMSYDETDLIFLGYSKLIKKLTRRQQAAVKYKIAKVIMDAELEEEDSGNPLKAKKMKRSSYESDDD